jgi:hypothetical protein
MRTKSLLCGCIVLLLMVVTTATPCLADNTIYGCVRGFTGILRIVSPPGHCLPGEAPISWNQTGPQGPQGQQGPKGDTGPAGPAGPAGGVTAVHGTVLYGGEPEGAGFTSNYNVDNPGLYTITFDTPFTGTPDCVISLQASPDDFCAIVGYGPSNLDVYCSYITVQNGILRFIAPQQHPFSFICISEPL